MDYLLLRIDCMEEQNQPLTQNQAGGQQTANTQNCSVSGEANPRANCSESNNMTNKLSTVDLAQVFARASE